MCFGTHTQTGADVNLFKTTTPCEISPETWSRFTHLVVVYHAEMPSFRHQFVVYQETMCRLTNIANFQIEMLKAYMPVSGPSEE